MKATGILRRVDELGRIVLPVELRRALEIEDRDLMVGDKIASLVSLSMTPLRIDKIKDICRRAADVGGVGDRYTCMIQGKERELWFEDGRWFVAAKVAVSQAPPSNE